MDARAEKLAKARKKLKDHQEKKSVINVTNETSAQSNPLLQVPTSFNENAKTAADNVSHINGKPESTNLYQNDHDFKSQIDLSEILISNKNSLEIQVSNLTDKLSHLEQLYNLELKNHNICTEKVTSLQSEVTEITNKYVHIVKETTDKDNKIKQLNSLNQSLIDENNNLSEQLEFTKSILTSKEFENAQVQSQIYTYQNQLDMLQLQIQQLTCDSPINIRQDNKHSEESSSLLQKIPNLEHKIESLQKERDHIQSHYEHYVQELNEQLQSEKFKNDELSNDLQTLYNRETSLVDQIREMEIRLQSYDMKNKDKINNIEETSVLNEVCENFKIQLKDINVKYSQLQFKYTEIVEENKKLQEENNRINFEENMCNHETVDVSKLSADIKSDKLAAQRATEQNKKLKLDIEGLEQVIVKMGKDKLELTEKWTHEKQLNKGLALKLAEVEECVKNMDNKLKAKDNEMIRLQYEYREIEKEYKKYQNDVVEQNTVSDAQDDRQNLNEEINNDIDSAEVCTEVSSPISQVILPNLKTKSIGDMYGMHKEDAMIKLQERFLNIMDEVANLSDEKHRLEHIILQLQNETDTICEYVALYQQQRSLLKRREEERSNQLKSFQAECDKLKRRLEELSELLLTIAAEEQFKVYFKEESKQNELMRVKELLQELENCLLINPNYKSFDLKVFYPCGCCSGQLLDI